MSRIDWGRRSGDEVETVVGILLCRRHLHVERIKPSQGDDGLDVILREDDGWTIWQVKKYADQPTPDQRSKIKKSFERALAFASREDVTIKHWYLVMPATPTPPSLKWFRELTDGHGFACSWLGEDFLDGLAAEFPDVIDYYFQDGKGRLAAALAQFASVTGIRVAHEGDEVQPADIVGPILNAHELINKLDPHFRYDFSVDSTMPDLASSKGAIFVESRGKGEQYFTLYIYEKYDGALQDRPITINGTLHTPDDAAREAVRDFIEYGADLSLEAATMEGDLPGGLDGSSRSGALYLTRPEVRQEDQRVVRIRTVDASGGDEFVAHLHMPPASSGIDGKNLLASATEALGDTFVVKNRYTDSTDALKLTFSMNDLTGKKPEKVLPALRFLRSLQVGRQFQLGPEFGPYSGRPVPIDKDLTHLVGDDVVRLIEAIAVLQEQTSEQLTIPDFATLSRYEGEQIIEAAALLRGEVVASSMPELRVTPNGSPLSEGEHAVLMTVEYEIDVNGVTVPVGNVAFHAPTARITTVRDENGEAESIRVRATDDGPVLRGTLRLLQSE